MARVVVDPITRIEGHLRIEAEVKNGKISNAYSSCTMWRGIERILKGRDPRDAWAFTQRICGVCTTVHAFASIRAVEDALGIEIPPLAQALRNLMIATQHIHDHTMHFYHLHALDWVNVPNALKADPKKTSALAQSLSNWPNSSPGYFKTLKEKLTRFVESGQLGIFANAYWDHPAYKLPAEVDLLAVAHYLEALDWQRHIVRIHTYLGGKNPHPNFLVGGVPASVNLSSPSVINTEVLSTIKTHVDQAVRFVREVYLPDLLAIASFYKEWARWGAGVGNYLVYGDLPEGRTSDVAGLFLPRGAILNRDLSKIYDVDPKDPEQVQESVAHSWYQYAKGDGALLHPFEGETEPNFTGPQPPYEYLNVDHKYSWLKAPRWKGHPMEVGPLARMLVAYAKGHPSVKEKVDFALKKLNVPLTALFSTLGRTAARGIEAWVLADYLENLYGQIVDLIRAGNTSTFNAEKWDAETWPSEARGFGYMEAPRGALGHWVTIKDKKIEHYQAVVPSTWNGGPRDADGQPGPYEASLQGTPVHDPAKPLEILRTVHSFDPCMACAAHVYDPEGREIVQVHIQ
ncbi:MAG: nickel-dependent hydrogenase large subunit [Calditrichaeota bacterium]|nr:MAG: nickel-dependent hydrogenase large subunit [Calditrichota bacterium]